MQGVTLIAELVESVLIQYTNIRLRPTFLMLFCSFDTVIDYTLF